MMDRNKIVQIAVAQGLIFALDSNGDIWVGEKTYDSTDIWEATDWHEVYGPDLPDLED